MIVLYCVLFFYGAVGADSRRGFQFTFFTGTLLFLMALPVMLTDANPIGWPYSVFEIAIVLIACELLAFTSYLGGRGARRVTRSVGSKVLRR